MGFWQGKDKKIEDMRACRYIPQEILNDDFSALDKANIFMLGASLYELATGTSLPTGAPSDYTHPAICGSDWSRSVKEPCL